MLLRARFFLHISYFTIIFKTHSSRGIKRVLPEKVILVHANVFGVVYSSIAGDFHQDELYKTLMPT